jgi:hypothetical protein
MISVIALKPSQDNNHSCQSNFKPVVQRIPQTTALDVSEKQKMQLSHSLGEPRPPGMPFRIRSKIASGPRSLETKWANLKVASAANTNRNQDIFTGVCSFTTFFYGASSTIRDAGRVSAFRNFCISRSAESFSLFVLDTVQSEGTNKSKSRM